MSTTHDTVTDRAAQLLELVSSATIVDLSVTTGERWPCSPYEGQPFGQFTLNWFTWPRGAFREYVQVHDDHTGTHFDAPCHQIPPPDSGLPAANEYGTISVEQVPLDQMIGSAAVIDVTALVENAPKGEKTRLKESPEILPEHVLDWEQRHGTLTSQEIVLFRSDWSDRYYRPLPEGFGYDRSHPAPRAETIELLHERGVRAIGTDGRGIGLMQDDYSPHWACLGRNIVCIENLTNLGSLPPRGALFVFASHKFEAASGGLGRAFGIVTG
ncbi:cyclase family protein [Pseudonocardia alni]|uniref:cyclase family protein n=1 Tax=Pseudonocardia alni TaxID=33907 RepID=UPI0033F2E62B